jgi:polysaccharide biosynthesis/export protein
MHKTIILFVATLLCTSVFAQDRNNGTEQLRLGPGDVIDVKFFYNAELNDTVQIRPDGRIALPLIGELPVSNRSIAEAAKLLETAYAPYLRTPAITIQPRNYGSQKIYVGGEVLRPGTVSLIGELTLLEAIMETGGPKQSGRKDMAILIRKGENDVPVMTQVSLKMEKNRSSPGAGMLLLPSDVVLVPETRITSVNHWVDTHIRQMLPVSFGFTYLFNGGFIR